MYIQPNDYNINMRATKNTPGFWKRLKEKALGAIPNATIKDNSDKIKNWKKVDEFVSRPAENRLIMGATALVTQPPIDYFNHRVDEETRVVSRNRTIAKILAGAGVGIVVRGSSYGLVQNMTNLKGKGRFNRALLPSNKTYLRDFIKNPKLLKNYRSALSTGIAILAMCFTNFLIDAPLTVYLTNEFNEKHAEKKKLLEGGQKDV